MTERLSAARLRVAARDAAAALAEGYAAAEGVGPDDYDETPRHHPMAEAKYVLACLDLAAAGVLRAELGARLDAALERLEASALRDDGRLAWGLGFPYRDLPADEPFVITTAMVLEAATAAAAAPTPRPEAWAALRDGAVRWLLEGVGRIADSGARLPAYSPHLPLVAYNVAAAWAGALTGALGPGHGRLPEVRAVAAAVRDRVIPGVGWPYGPDNPRVDLLHTGYVVRGLLAALPGDEAVVRAGLPGLLAFVTAEGWDDAFDVYPLQVGPGPDLGEGRQAVRVVGDHVLVALGKPARSWSVGELCVALADLAGAGARADVVTGQRRRAVELALRRHAAEPNVRHAMHVAHGLARFARDGTQR